VDISEEGIIKMINFGPTLPWPKKIYAVDTISLEDKLVYIYNQIHLGIEYFRAEVYVYTGTEALSITKIGHTFLSPEDIITYVTDHNFGHPFTSLRNKVKQVFLSVEIGEKYISLN
jgi:hypothetical protein